MCLLFYYKDALLTTTSFGENDGPLYGKIKNTCTHISGSNSPNGVTIYILRDLGNFLFHSLPKTICLFLKI